MSYRLTFVVLRRNVNIYLHTINEKVSPDRFEYNIQIMNVNKEIDTVVLSRAGCQYDNVCFPGTVTVYRTRSSDG